MTKSLERLIRYSTVWDMLGFGDLLELFWLAFVCFLIDLYLLNELS